jgi:hypothetical protein
MLAWGSYEPCVVALSECQRDRLVHRIPLSVSDLLFVGKEGADVLFIVAMVPRRVQSDCAGSTCRAEPGYDQLRARRNLVQIFEAEND